MTTNSPSRTISAIIAALVVAVLVLGGSIAYIYQSDSSALSSLSSQNSALGSSLSGYAASIATLDSDDSYIQAQLDLLNSSVQESLISQGHNTGIIEQSITSIEAQLSAENSAAASLQAQMGDHNSSGWAALENQIQVLETEVASLQAQLDGLISVVDQLLPHDNASVIAAGISTPPTEPSSERKVVSGAGLYWAFFTNGNDMVYSTSADGKTWSTPVTIVPGGYRAWWFSVYQNGSELYYAYATTGVTTTPFIYYGYGSLESNGTISWQLQSGSVATMGTYPDTPSITVDSSGNIWLSVETYGNDSTRHIEVWKMSDGAWNEVFDKGDLQAYPDPILSTLSGDRVALEILSATGNLTIYTTGDGGATWSSGVNATSQYQDYSSVSVGDTVYTAGVDLSGNVKILSYTYGASSFSPETTLASSAYAYNGVAIGTDGTSSLVVLYSNSSTILMQNSTTLGSSWNAPTTLAFNEDNIYPSSLTMGYSVAPNVFAIWSTYSPGSTTIYAARFIAVPYS